MRTITHLTASFFHGGPERQMLGLAAELRKKVSTGFLSFSEGGHCGEFMERCRRAGYAADALENDTPRLRAAVSELAQRLRADRTEILLCHGYKVGFVGRAAARRVGIPVVAVSRGWTYANLNVRAYEVLDRLNLRWMDRVVCVSEGQARKVRGWGIAKRKIRVIPNAIDMNRFCECGLIWSQATSRILRASGAVCYRCRLTSCRFQHARGRGAACRGWGLSGNHTGRRRASPANSRAHRESRSDSAVGRERALACRAVV